MMWEKTSGSDGYVYGLYDSDGFMSVYPQMHQVVYIKYVQLLMCQLFLNLKNVYGIQETEILI